MERIDEESCALVERGIRRPADCGAARASRTPRRLRTAPSRSRRNRIRESRTRSRSRDASRCAGDPRLRQFAPSCAHRRRRATETSWRVEERHCASGRAADARRGEAGAPSGIRGVVRIRQLDESADQPAGRLTGDDRRCCGSCRRRRHASIPGAASRKRRSARCCWRHTIRSAMFIGTRMKDAEPFDPLKKRRAPRWPGRRPLSPNRFHRLTSSRTPGDTAGDHRPVEKSPSENGRSRCVRRLPCRPIIRRCRATNPAHQRPQRPADRASTRGLSGARPLGHHLRVSRAVVVVHLRLKARC